MESSYGSLLFTPVIQALQEKYGSRRQYARMAEGSAEANRLGPDEAMYIAERDMFYMASVGSTGWPYVQHRGGPKGFLKVIDDSTIGFADFRGNKQFVSTGNLMTDNRVALILVDYPRQARLKILGRAEIFEGKAAGEWIEKLKVPGYKAVVERAYIIRIEGLDWNCQQHITPRFTEAEIREVLAPFERRLAELERENKEFRRSRGNQDAGI